MAEGHRERLRNRFEYEQVDDLPEYIILEMLLQGVIVRRDTCEVARLLIQQFGSFAGVIDAPMEELVKVPGVGKAAATHLKLLPKYYRRYVMSRWENNIRFADTDMAGRYLMDRYIGYTEEVAFLICMDKSYTMLACRRIQMGNSTGVDVNVRNVLQTALQYDSRYVILAHNHPSGDPNPTAADVATTNELVRLLRGSGISLKDHIIISSNDYFSFLENGYIAGCGDINE